MQSTVALEKLAHEMPRGILWIHYEKRSKHAPIQNIQSKIPTAEIQCSTEEVVTMIILSIPAANTDEGDAPIVKAQKAWRWQTAIKVPRRFLDIMRSLLIKKMGNNPEGIIIDQTAQEAVDTLWAGQEGSQHMMTIGNAGIRHRDERSWWTQGLSSLEQIRR